MSRSLARSLVLLTTLAVPATASAGIFEHKSMHAPWAPRQVDHEIVLPRGWFQLGLSADHKSTSLYRDDDGWATYWENGATWSYSRLWLNLDIGFSKRMTFYSRAPFVWARLANDRGAIAETIAIGDIHAGVLWQPWLEHPWAVAFRFDLKTPSGIEWPRGFSGGPDNVEGFLTGTGTTHLGFFAEGRWRFGHVVRLGLEAGYVWKIPAIVGYVVEDGGFGNGWLNPGDEVRTRLQVTGQIIDGLAITAEGVLSWRDWFKMGVSGPGVTLTEMYYYEPSKLFLDVGGHLDWDPLDQLGFTAGASWQALGGSTLTFAHLGLEDFAPQPGVTFRFDARVRW